MKIKDAFPSKYLKAEDLGDTDLAVTIERIVQEEIGQGEKRQTKLVLYFDELAQGMVCNKTNANVISNLYGDETNDWKGKQITLWPNHDVEFQGEIVSAIRVRNKVPQAVKPEGYTSEKISTGQTEGLVNYLIEKFKFPPALLNGFLESKKKTGIGVLSQKEASELIDILEAYGESHAKGLKK